MFQEQVTVEFTPGLTTRRPVGRQATKKNLDLPASTVSAKVHEQVRSLREMNIDFDKHIPSTPPMPKISKANAESVKLIKSLRKAAESTPQRPTLSIDPSMHTRLLQKKL
jgi:hypothetical protein